MRTAQELGDLGREQVMASGSLLGARRGQTSLSSLGCVVGKGKKIETKGKIN